MRLIAVAFALGAAWLQTRPELPEFRWLWLTPLGLTLAAWLPVEGRYRHAHGLAWLAVAALAGFYYAAWRAELRLAEALAPAWEGRDLALQGRVVGLPEATGRGWRFGFAVERAAAPGAAVPGRVMLNLYDFANPDAEPVRAGECLRLTARLHRPHGNANPGGFDYEAWLLERDIRALGYLTAAPGRVGDCGGAWRAALDRAREAVRGRLQTALAGQPYAGVVVALAVGDQNAISDAQWTLFRHTGVTHLMSISGLHVTLFSALAFWCVQAFWRRAPGLCLYVPARKAGAAVGLAAAAAYVALAGFGIPAQRTLYMLATAVAILLASRATSATRTLAAALFAVVLIDPWAALSPGFWLSFGAVAALVLASAGRMESLPAWRAWIRAQAAVSLALIPALLAIFHEVSLVSPLANAFAIPLVSLVVVPLTLTAAALPWDGVAWLAHAVLALVMQGLVWLDALPQPVWHGAQPGPLGIGLALLGAAVLLMPRGLPGRWLGAVLFLPLLFPRIERPGPGEAWLHVLDVGQGLAVVARTQGHALAFDAGPLYASGEDAGRRVVAPFLFAQGITRLDGLVVSHDDSDHSGGAASLGESHRPAWALSPIAAQSPERLSPHGHTLRQGLPRMTPCRAGQSWTWDGVTFEVLHPPAHHYANPNYSDNERSCVLKVTSPHGAALLPADIERLGELNLQERVPEKLAAEVLVAPHHGSGSSSSPAFVAAVRPRYVVFSAGHRNRYGHPKGEVVQRYREAGAQPLRTDREGALEIRFTQQGIEVEKAREVRQRYWQGR